MAELASLLELELDMLEYSRSSQSILNRNTGDHTLFPEPLPQNSVRNEDESLIVTWPVSFPKERGVVSSLYISCSCGM